MIEINLDSADRRNNKIIIDGEDICQKYKVSGFNLKSDSDCNFVIPILTIDIWDEDIKLVCDKNETIINKRYICDNAFYISKSVNCLVNVADVLTNVEYKNWKNGKPQQVNIIVDYAKLKSDKHLSFFNLETGEKVHICGNNKLQYEGEIKKIALPSDENLVAITCMLYQ